MKQQRVLILSGNSLFSSLDQDAFEKIFDRGYLQNDIVKREYLLTRHFLRVQ